MIKYRNINEICTECPLYTKDTKDRNKCFIKYVNNLNVLMSVIDEKIDIDEDNWNADCGGDWMNCAILPILYFQEDEDEEDQENTSQEIGELIDSGAEDYSPFDTAEEEPKVSKDKPVKDNVVVKINKVLDPYLVKADVLVYPTNSALLIDDDLLNRRSRFNVQKECDQYIAQLDEIKMGTVYVTTNGGKLAGGVIPDFIYHAVVAGPSRLVSANINKAIIQSLYLADKNGAKVVAMLPCDCGILDIGEGAMAQLVAIKTYIEKAEIKNIERIHIVMDDDISIGVFKEYFERIF